MNTLSDWYRTYEGKYQRLGMFARDEKELVNCRRTIAAGHYCAQQTIPDPAKGGIMAKAKEREAEEEDSGGTQQ